ncbi:hypothetical protein [Nonomuraea maheshkhaliensis]
MNSDELKVPSQRHDANDIDDEQAGEKRVHEDRLVAGDRDPLPGDDVPVADGPAVPSDGAAPRDGAAPYDEDDASYRDPYARTGGDMLADPGPGPAPGHEPEQSVPSAPGEVPAHAAPDDIVLFEQDPTQVQARWRDLQASFVDDPGEAVQRADGLVGEVVDSLTSALNNRTDALRDRWKDTGGGDTEQLRLALREYRTVLERLLALSGQSSPQSSGQSSGQPSGQPSVPTPVSSEGMR